MVEVATFGDADGLILTGIMHYLNLVGFGGFLEGLYPAILDPLFSGSGLAPGYLTTVPGARSRIYDTANADPKVIALDESIKQTMTDGELDSLLGFASSPEFFTLMLNVKVPILIVDGQYDVMLCGGAVPCDTDSIAAFESPFFSPESHLQVGVIPNAGHVINLQLNARTWFDLARDWADKYVGTSRDVCKNDH
jgi:hypothetical protein